MAAKISEKQKAFCQEYLVDLNGKQAAIRAGYTPKTAEVQASRLLSNAKVKEYLSVLMQQKASSRIASADEVLGYLTSVLRGESTAEVLVHESLGEGVSKVFPMMKHPDEKDRLKAAEILSKYHGLAAPQQLEVKAEIRLDHNIFSEMMTQVRAMAPEEREAYRLMLKEKMNG